MQPVLRRESIEGQQLALPLLSANSEDFERPPMSLKASFAGTICGFSEKNCDFGLSAESRHALKNETAQSSHL
jgi:hypothetical protein